MVAADQIAAKQEPRTIGDRNLIDWIFGNQNTAGTVFEAHSLVAADGCNRIIQINEGAGARQEWVETRPSLFGQVTRGLGDLATGAGAVLTGKGAIDYGEAARKGALADHTTLVNNQDQGQTQASTNINTSTNINRNKNTATAKAKAKADAQAQADANAKGGNTKITINNGKGKGQKHGAFNFEDMRSQVRQNFARHMAGLQIKPLVLKVG
jgi:hypothetical protein